MTDAQLACYSAWASILGFIISIVTLAYVRSVKTNIINFRRKQRIRSLINDILRLTDDARPLSSDSQAKLAALRRNISVHAWSRFTPHGKVKLEIHKHIDAGDIRSLKEALYDLASYSEDA